MVDKRYKKFKISNALSKDDLETPEEKVTKALLYKGHEKLEAKIEVSPRLDFLKKKIENFEVIQIDEKRKRKYVIDTKYPLESKPIKKVNVSSVSIDSKKTITGDSESRSITHEAKTKRKYLFNVEDFTAEDFEFLEIAKKITFRKRSILGFFYEKKAYGKESLSIGSRNPSKTIFFKKDVLTCEDSLQNQPGKNWFTKSDLEKNLKKNMVIKKWKMCTASFYKTNNPKLTRK